MVTTLSFFYLRLSMFVATYNTKFTSRIVVYFCKERLTYTVISVLQCYLDVHSLDLSYFHSIHCIT